jgi:hypothetical protein
MEYSVFVSVHRLFRILGFTLSVSTIASLVAPSAGAQWSKSYRSSSLPGTYNWQLRRQFPDADALLNAAEFARYNIYGALMSSPRDRTGLESADYDFLIGVFAMPPRLPVHGGGRTEKFGRLAPEAVAMLDWADDFTRQVYDVWADPSIPANEKDGRVTELLGHYRMRGDLALSSMPKSMDVMDSQIYSLAFRRGLPKSNGLLWAGQWLQTGLFEPLMIATSTTQRKSLVDATITRFRRMVKTPLESTPYLMPLAPTIAPTFARRYPETAAILDNLHMMDNVVADILSSPEIPASAKRKEILHASATFRSDTAYAVSYDEWFRMGEVMGLNNMGGSPVGTLLPVTPSVPRGLSMDGVTQEIDSSTMTMDSMGQGASPANPAGIDMPGMPVEGSGNDAAGFRAIFDRMMLDPVIRERVATDPVLQKMIQGARGAAGAEMDMSGPNSVGGGMSAGGGKTKMGGMSAPTMDQQRATEFIVRLLSDPSVAGKIQADPELRGLWLDTEVQRRLRELRAKTPAKQEAPVAPPAPVPPAGQTHKHS